jgi:hypothetical protein
MFPRTPREALRWSSVAARVGAAFWTFYVEVAEINYVCSANLDEIERTQTTGWSMLPTLQSGEIVAVNHWHHRYGKNLRRGDLIMLMSPRESDLFLSKRLIGLVRF